MPSVTRTSLRRVPAASGCEKILQVLSEDGGVIIEGFLTQDQVKRANAEIDPAIDSLMSGSKHGDEWTKEFHGSQTKRLTNLCTLSPTFAKEILDKDLAHDLCERIFSQDSGTYWMNTAQVIEIGPGNKAQPLHRDQMQYPIWTLFGPEAPEATVNFLIALTDFTDENGATRVIPGSHSWQDMKDYGRPDDTIPAEMNAGDVLFISGKVVHGGGANRTRNEKRRGIAFSIQCSYLTPEEAYPFMIPLETAKGFSPRVQRMIGFRSQFPKDCPGLWQWDYEELGTRIGLEA